MCHFSKTTKSRPNELMASCQSKLMPKAPNLKFGICFNMRLQTLDRCVEACPRTLCLLTLRVTTTVSFAYKEESQVVTIKDYQKKKISASLSLHFLTFNCFQNFKMTRRKLQLQLQQTYRNSILIELKQLISLLGNQRLHQYLVRQVANGPTTK